MEGQAQQSSLTSFLVSRNPIDSDQSTGPRAIQMCILRLREESFHEEQSGCFGKAEVLWKKATGLAERYLPASQLFARVAIDTGSFLFRFLPKSQIPLKYLRAGLSFSQLLGAGEVTRATVTLAKCLIGCKFFEESKKLLNQIDRSIPEIDVQVLCCFGMIESAKQDILKSESILRKAVEKAQSLNPELHAECVMHLCEVLLEKEQYLESQSLLPPLLPSLVSKQSPFLHLVLRVLMETYQETNQFALLDSTLRSVVADLEAANAPPYYIAEILIEWGDCYSHVSPSCAALCYIRSLRLYKSVRPCSWYTAGALHRLLRLRYSFLVSVFWRSEESLSPWPVDACERSFELLETIASDLPVVTTALSLKPPEDLSILTQFIDHKSDWIRKKLEPLAYIPDEVESGEALLCLTSPSTYDRFQLLIKIYASSHPNNQFSSRLLSLLPYEDRGSLESARPGASIVNPTSPSDPNASEDINEAHSGAAPVSFEAVDELVRQSCDSQIRQDYEEADSAQERALRMAEAINPFSSRYFTALFTSSKNEHSPDTFMRVLRANSHCPLPVKMIAAMNSKLTDWLEDTDWFTKCLEMSHQLDEMVCAVPLHIAFLDRIRSCQYFLATLKRILLYYADNRKSISAHYRQLKAELDWLYGEERQLVLCGRPSHLYVVSELARTSGHSSREVLIARGFTMMEVLKYEIEIDLHRHLNSLRGLYN